MYFIKFGGSIITDKSAPYTVRKDVLSRLCREIHDARSEKNIPLVIGHGGGSFPHVSAHKYQTHKGYINENSKRGFSEVQNDASKLNRMVIQELLNAGENAVSVQPSACCMADKGRIVEFYTVAMERMLEDGYIPVPFGDSVLDKTNGCCIVSTEEIFRYLAKKLKPSKIILVGKVEGVLRDVNDPASIIKEINALNFRDVKDVIMGSDATDVTGGMVSKVGDMIELAGTGVDSIIINGLTPGNLHDAILGKRDIGTLITK